MANIANLLTEHMATWTAAESEKKLGRGRASGNAGSVYGVKKLRELILELAVHGKLVPQDNQNASDNFKFAKLGDIVEVLDSLRKPVTKQDRVEGPYPYYGASGIVDFVSNYIFDEPLVLVGEDGAKWGAGESTAFMIEGKTWVNNHAHVIRPNRDIVTDKFLTYCLVAMDLNEFITGMTVPKLNQARLVSIKIPLPTLADQHRIVAKVDELMALCDQLEQQHSNAQEAHETLVSQLLATLTQSQNAAEFNANWQRIYAHFDVLFTTEASIDALKQTLLQLAVMGKLVPQDPNDEPASELIKRIQAEKAKLIPEGKLKKEKPLTPISEDEKPFGLPKGWEWIALETIAQVGTGATPLRSKPEYFNPATVSWVTSGETSGSYIFKTEQYVSPLALKETNLTVYPKGSLIVAMYGQGKTRGQITELMIEACTNQACAAIRLYMIDDFHRKYVKLFFEKIYDEIRELSAGGAQPNLNLSKVKETLIPLPPLAEQHRIVAKVDALMALCDQLKTRIQQANQQQQAIADVLVAQALKPATAEIMDLAAYRAVVTCNIIKRMQHNQAFGRTFAMKLLYLSQQHIGFETHLEFEREAAGPFDKWIYDFEREGSAAGWFGLVEKRLSSGNTKIEYKVKSAIDQPLAMIDSVGSAEQRKELDRLFALFTDKKTEEAEIVATLFAAWNDYLIDGKFPTDDEIVQEVRENWHESKAKFSPPQLKEWLDWMRKNQIVPQGRLPRTLHQQRLNLH